MMNGLSGSLWPIHLKPYPDELLSSWLVRLAHAHGLKLQTFCSIVFGRGRNIWNRDIDKYAPDWLLHHLVTATGTSIERVKETTLKSYEGIVYECHQPNGNTRWLTPLGIYHRIHHHPGLQFCPLCLAADEEPYYRKYWRLAFYTECRKHHILLQDRCHDCGSPINFHRVEMGIRSLIKPRSIINCYQCNFDLRYSKIEKLHCDDWQTTSTFRAILDFHDLGWAFNDTLTLQYSHQLFDVLRHICGLMCSSRKASCLLPIAASKIGLDIKEIDLPRSPTYEHLNVVQRTILIQCAIWLTLRWPWRFIETCKQLNLTSAYLLVDYCQSPFWFYSIINEYLNQRQYSPTHEEINAAKHYLITKGVKAGITRVSALLGCATLKR